MALKFNDDLVNSLTHRARENEDESVAQSTAKRYGLPFMDLVSYPIQFTALGTIEEAIAKEAFCIAFHRAGKRLFIAMNNPDNPKTKILIEKLKKDEFIITQFIASMKGLNKAFSRYADMKNANAVDVGVISVNEKIMKEFADQIHSVADFKNVSDKMLAEGKTSTTKFFEIILAGAYSLGISDIHIEPTETIVRVRYRLDGVLHDVLEIPSQAFHFFKSRLKILAGVRLNQDAKAQDGRFTIRITEKDIEVRVSIIPGNFGESAVMRLLDPDNIKVDLETLGYEPYLKKIVFEAIERPNGIVLLTGPTKSGKTTTLYACMQKIYNPDLKIITIENPIEYKLAGIVQTQVEDHDTSYTFASAMRAVLRQDPDVIMVGEIRDKDTAETAIQAALTGHLVFSTLHTNTAAGVIPRLIDIGVNAKILGSSLSLSLAQRLLRRVCKNCKEEYEATDDEKKMIDDVVKGMKEFKKEKFLEEFNGNYYKLARGKGCEVCNGFGYKGRAAVHEGMYMNGEIEKIMADNPSERDVQRVASSQGFLTLREDALLKILRGVTTLDEANKIVGMWTVL
jgi:type IV pilus assembly protein PilB